MLYQMHQAQRLAMLPTRMIAEALRFSLRNPWNPLSHTQLGRQISSAADVFEQFTRPYGKPVWALDQTEIDGIAVTVTPEVKIQRTYGHLVHFRRDMERKDDPKLLIVAPMSGHFATLLRGTVEAMLPDHDVYITDWIDARLIPVNSDRFNLSDYIDYLIDFLHFLGPNTHVLAVCQPSVPVLAACSVMATWGDLCAPATATLMGGPIDTRENPTAVNKLAKEHPIEWFERNVITKVPFPYPGAGREVYPGFIQLTNFISMNLDRHMQSLNQLFEHLVQGDDEGADKKSSFYQEYLAVMDLPAEFYLQTVKNVFMDHTLPQNQMVARWQPVLPERITKTAILCVEGELDDISGVGQTKAALTITPNLDSDMKAYHLQEQVGHYGVFNGGKWRRFIAPRVKAFIREHDHERGTARRRAVAVTAPATGDRRAARKVTYTADRRGKPAAE
jgi:poly(3-hydroxybutyrate) depolymerase